MDRHIIVELFLIIYSELVNSINNFTGGHCFSNFASLLTSLCAVPQSLFITASLIYFSALLQPCILDFICSVSLVECLLPYQSNTGCQYWCILVYFGT